MSTARLEVHEDGLYRIQDVFEKTHESRVSPDWHVLFIDDAKQMRLGYVLHVDALHQELQVVDEVVHRNPHSFDVEPEIIDFIRVLEASNGYIRPKRDVYTERRKSCREVWMLEESSTTGFIVTTSGIRLYVERMQDQWRVR